MDGSDSSLRNIRGGMRITFTWISHFGAPETITSDRGPQFTSSLWFQLCEMLNISHKQTTAYHPELNGAVQRLHHGRIKDALRARTTAAIWSKDYPLYSSDSEHNQGKTLVFPWLRQFSVPKLSCQINFRKMTNFQLTLLSKFFQNFAFFCPFA
jgi:transposase InsO family protein